MVEVKVLSEERHTVLVEWQDEGTKRRGFLPKGSVIAGQAEAAELACAIPYGVPWAEVVTITVTPEAIEQALRQAGMWTYADVRADPQRVVNVLQRLYGVQAAAIVTAARRYETGGTK